MQKRGRLHCNQTRGFGWFGQDPIAHGQCGGDLSGKYGQRKIPRANAGENTIGGGAKLLCLMRVIAQEIHRLAQLTNAVTQCFTGLMGKQSKIPLRMALIEICSFAQRRGPLGWSSLPRGGSSGHLLRLVC